MVLPRNPDGGAGATAGSQQSSNNTAISQLYGSLVSAKPTAISKTTKNPTLSNGAALGRPGVAAPDLGGPPLGSSSGAQRGDKLSNPPLHPLTESTFLYGHDAVSLQRGAIVRSYNDARKPETYIPDPKARYSFRFLFNPETINFTNSTSTGIVDPGSRNTVDVTVPMFVGQESLNFGLLLDRSQEAYEQGIGTHGTLDDVEALYRVCNGPLGSSAGFLSLSAVVIYWGPTNSAGRYTQNGRPLPPFPCYITGINITHTQFNPRMCPIRTEVSISAARLVGGKGSAFAANTGLSAVGG